MKLLKWEILNVLKYKIPKKELLSMLNLQKLLKTVHFNKLHLPVAVYDGCGILAFVYWLRLK